MAQHDQTARSRGFLACHCDAGKLRIVNRESPETEISVAGLISVDCCDVEIFFTVQIMNREGPRAVILGVRLIFVF